MLRLKSLTQGAVALSLALAVLWSLLACASLCTFETAFHDTAISTCEAVDDDDGTNVQPIDDCCGCPEISSPTGTVQHRETGDLIARLGSRAFLDIDIPTNIVVSNRTADPPDGSPPKINAPPLFVLLHTFRI